MSQPKNLAGILFILTVALGMETVEATQVWDGPSITFAEGGTDPTKATNQDRITPNVWLTRAATRGLFNAKHESGYTQDFSPEDTEWANGSLANYATLSYQPWEIWNGKNPPSMVGQQAVVHFISEDIYLSISFTFWGSSAAGRFSYVRSTPAQGAADTPLLTPITTFLLASLLAGVGGFFLMGRHPAQT